MMLWWRHYSLSERAAHIACSTTPDPANPIIPISLDLSPQFHPFWSKNVPKKLPWLLLFSNPRWVFICPGSSMSYPSSSPSWVSATLEFGHKECNRDLRSFRHLSGQKYKQRFPCCDGRAVSYTCDVLLTNTKRECHKYQTISGGEIKLLNQLQIGHRESGFKGLITFSV